MSVKTHSSYETVIGIEVHVQLNTRTKIFCSCPNFPSKEPNTHICPICTGQPGVLPLLNRAVVDSALAAALATNSTINTVNEFDRKHYFYPDLPKNYQITQTAHPICVEGVVTITREDDTSKKIRIHHIHMEEDAGKNIHAQGDNESFVDFNRAGTPLLEIVTYPDISNAHEAKAYLRALHGIVTYLGICSGNMEEGAFRADTNISVRKIGDQKLGTKCELKNINSFKFIGDAIEYEVNRQITLLEAGERVIQETRLWDTKEKKTITMRIKEEAADYRYFTDPDLPQLHIDTAWIERIRASLPELPAAKLERLQKTHTVSAYEAEILINDRALSAYYEQAYAHHNSKLIINWVLRDIISYLNEHKMTPEQCPITPEKLATLVQLLEKDVINNHAAKQVFELIAQTGKSPEQLVKEHNLEQLGTSAELEQLVEKILAQHPQEIAEYKSGKEKLFGFFVGILMKETQGKANPKIISQLLQKKIKE